MSDRRRWLLVVLGALALAGSYPPFRLPFLSFVAVAPAVLLLADAGPDTRRAWRWGFRYGLVANGLVLYWMIVALWHFTALAALGYFVTVFLLGIFTGGLFWFIARVRLAYPRLGLALVFPIAWTALEWAVGHLGDAAFPWLGLGTSLADAPVLVQWADLAGARGVTWWLAWCNVLMAQGVLAWGQWRPVARRLGAVALSVALAAGYGVWRARSVRIVEVGTLALIQPDVASGEKWEADPDSQIAALIELSRRAAGMHRVNLFVWPESALPGFLPQHPDWTRQVAAFAAREHVPVLTGALDVDFSAAQTYQTYNAAFYFDSLGLTQPYPPYHKHYLVPVVERVPFVPVSWFRALPWLGRWSGGFGHGKRVPLYATGVGRAGVLICYESAFEQLARAYRREGADFLVNITNDAWFGRTAGPYQHASHLILRAIETRMGIARAANDGVSEFVDPLGRVTQPSRLGTQAVVVGPLRTSDARTPYVRLGDWVGTLSIIATLGFAGGLVLKRWNRGG